jgi:hypothetical protein
VCSPLVQNRNVLSALCREGMVAFLPPEPAPPVRRASKTPSNAKADTKPKPDTTTKRASNKPGAPLSLSPKAP